MMVMVASTWLGDEPGHCDPGEDETDTRMLLRVSVITIHSVVGIFIHSYYDYFPCESVFFIILKFSVCCRVYYTLGEYI